jgi:hypothetical protein
MKKAPHKERWLLGPHGKKRLIRSAVSWVLMEKKVVPPALKNVERAPDRTVFIKTVWF